MPCFIRILRRLGIDLPSDVAFTEWLESGLREEFRTESHEELRSALTYYENFYPEKLREIVENLLRKWRRVKEEEFAIV